eukprot:3934526-Rhodomonas_salina.2
MLPQTARPIYNSGRNATAPNNSSCRHSTQAGPQPNMLSVRTISTVTKNAANSSLTNPSFNLAQSASHPAFKFEACHGCWSAFESRPLSPASVGSRAESSGGV